MKRNTSITFFLAVFSQLCIAALGRITYDGLVLTSIDVTPVKDKPGFVTFKGGKLGKSDDDTATFLDNVKQINDTDEAGERLFEGRKLSVAEAKAILNEASPDGKNGKPLFCLHGFNVQPGNHLKAFNEKRMKGTFSKGKFMPVPVIWPSQGGVDGYWGDRGNSAPGAGKAFKTLKRGVDSFPSKSILCHSMGNWVLRHAADAKFRFDNIFLVAAVSADVKFICLSKCKPFSVFQFITSFFSDQDVRYDLFQKKYIRESNDERREDGLRICKMLTDKNKGKVHILYNAWDYALIFSSLNPTTWLTRIGTLGYKSYRNWRGAWTEDEGVVDDEVKGSLKNFNAGAKLSWTNKAAHIYQYEDFCVKYYQDNHY